MAEPGELKLAAALEQTFRDPADAQAWMLEPMPALGGRTPTELVREGRTEEVLAVLYALNAGVAN